MKVIYETTVTFVINRQRNLESIDPNLKSAVFDIQAKRMRNMFRILHFSHQQERISVR